MFLAAAGRITRMAAGSGNFVENGGAGKQKERKKWARTGA